MRLSALVGSRFPSEKSLSCPCRKQMTSSSSILFQSCFGVKNLLRPFQIGLVISEGILLFANRISFNVLESDRA